MFALFISIHFLFLARILTDLRVIFCVANFLLSEIHSTPLIPKPQLLKKIGWLFSSSRYNRNRDTNRERQRPGLRATWLL